MRPLEFPEQTMVWAKDQAPYLPLPAYTNDRETITLWGLTWRERLRVLWTGRLWLRQLNFGGALQPQKPTTTSPFTPVGDSDYDRDLRWREWHHGYLGLVLVLLWALGWRWDGFLWVGVPLLVDDLVQHLVQAVTKRFWRSPLHRLYGLALRVWPGLGYIERWLNQRFGS